MILASPRRSSIGSTDPAIGAVLFTGNGPKGFCSAATSGGAALVVAGTPEQATGIRSRIQVNALIARYPKPLVALGHGITMGGGSGSPAIAASG